MDYPKRNCLLVLKLKLNDTPTHSDLRLVCCFEVPIPGMESLFFGKSEIPRKSNGPKKTNHWLTTTNWLTNG
jgi:hypothetical protein